MTTIDWKLKRAPQDWRSLDAELALPSDRAIREWAAATTPPRGNITARIVARRGERAVARLLKLPMDVRDRRGARRVSFVLPTGLKLDVQTKLPPKLDTYPDITLATSEPERFLAIVLVVWLGEHYEPLVPGWAWEEEVRAIRPQTIATGRIHTMGVRSLHPMHTLIHAVVPDESAAQATMFEATANEEGGGFWSRKDR